MTTETCMYCGTVYEIEDEYRSVGESTRDVEPPTMYAVWRIKDRERTPDDFNDPDNLLHMCKRGVLVPKCMTCNRYDLGISSCSNPYHGPNNDRPNQSAFRPEPM